MFPPAVLSLFTQFSKVLLNSGLFFRQRMEISAQLSQSLLKGKKKQNKIKGDHNVLQPGQKKKKDTRNQHKEIAPQKRDHR